MSVVSWERDVSDRSMSSLSCVGIGDDKVQYSGVLFKKPFGHQSTKWQKRYESQQIKIKSACTSRHEMKLCIPDSS